VVSRTNNLTKLGGRRYVGDSATMLAHDTWHGDCQGCGLDETLRNGHAVGFEPDTLDGALWAGYEYCETCHDRTEPVPPAGADENSAPSGTEPEQEIKMPPSTPPAPDRGRAALRREVFGIQRTRSTPQPGFGLAKCAPQRAGRPAPTGAGLLFVRGIVASSRVPEAEESRCPPGVLCCQIQEAAP